MSKTIIYLVLLIVLGVGVWYFLFSDKNVFGVNEAGFQVKDTASIGKIFLADKSGNTIVLERKDKGWVLNNTYPALAAPINTLMQTLAEQEPVYPVPENMHNMVVRNMAATGIKVELYKRNGKEIAVFYVGGQVSTTSGSYMLVDGAKRPYVVQIPGFDGYLTPRYSTNMKDWRDRTVFRLPADELQSVAVTYPDMPLNNFTLTKDAAGKVSVQVDPVLTEGNAYNERRAKVYSGFFENINCEGYINGIPHMDSILASTPKKCIIDVKGRNGYEQHVEVYWMPQDQRSKNLDTPDPETPEGFDSDRFYATMNNFKDTIIVQRTSFDKLFRSAFEFYQPDEQPTAPDTLLKNRTFRAPKQ